MSELKCNLVEDLMPLYIDDLVSDDTKKDIEAHLSECETCRSMCEELKKDINLWLILLYSVTMTKLWRKVKLQL